MKKLRHRQILGLAELRFGSRFFCFHSLLFLLRTRDSRQMLRCLWQIMVHLNSIVNTCECRCFLELAGELLLGIRSHYLSVNGNMNLITTKECPEPLSPVMPIAKFSGTSRHPGYFGKYSKISMQVVLRIFCIKKKYYKYWVLQGQVQAWVFKLSSYKPTNEQFLCWGIRFEGTATFPHWSFSSLYVCVTTFYIYGCQLELCLCS